MLTSTKTEQQRTEQKEEREAKYRAVQLTGNKSIFFFSSMQRRRLTETNGFFALLDFSLLISTSEKSAEFRRIYVVFCTTWKNFNSCSLCENSN